jgi:precorrin-6B methylase 2
MGEKENNLWSNSRDVFQQEEMGMVALQRVMALVALSLLVLAANPFGQTSTAPLRAPDVIYVPTPTEVVTAMLKLANVGPNDVVYDLGSGDGRIPIAAVEQFNAKSAVGIDINPVRIKEATENLAKSKAGNRVRFLNQDLFETPIGEASVVTLYLLQSLNEKLMPKLRKELKPGSRVVSQTFSMGASWQPDQTIMVDGRSVYLWNIK